MHSRSIFLRTLAAVALAVVPAMQAHAQQKQVKIGVIYDATGPFAAGGSQVSAIGTRIAIDMIDERGWPARLCTADPVLPWPKTHSYSNQ